MMRVAVLALSLLCVEGFSPSSAGRARAAPLRATDTGDALSCFSRVGDKMYVLKPDEVTGTAASGYEFGILQAGRPKWLCTYRSRAGQMQGGGAEVTHEPGWRALFGTDARLADRAALSAALAARAPAMPLGAPSGFGDAAAAAPSDEAVDAFWRLLGGADGAPLAAEEAETALRAAAAKHSTDEDQLNFAAFEAALRA